MVENARAALVMLCRHVARLLSVVALHAACPADQAAASDAAGHAGRLAAVLCAMPGPRPPVSGVEVAERPARRTAAILPAA